LVARGDDMRLNFEFTEQQVKDLKELRQKSGSTTMKELFNNALSVFEWTIDQSIKGKKIASVDEEDKSYSVLVALPLQRAAKLYQLEKV